MYMNMSTPPIPAFGRTLAQALYLEAASRSARVGAPGCPDSLCAAGQPQIQQHWRGGGGGGGSSSGVGSGGMEGGAAWHGSSAPGCPLGQLAPPGGGDEGHEYIGDEEGGGASQSGGAGVAPEHARPGLHQASQQQRQQLASADEQWAAAGPGPGSVSDPTFWPQQHQALDQQQQRDPGGGARGAQRTSSSSAADAAGDRASALERYRLGPGAASAQLLNENHAKMRAAKRAARDLALQLNGVKQELDGLKEVAGGLRAARLERGGAEAQVGMDMCGRGASQLALLGLNLGPATRNRLLFIGWHALVPT